MSPPSGAAGVSTEDAKRARDAARVAYLKTDPYSPTDERGLLRRTDGKTQTASIDEETTDVECADAVADPVRVDQGQRRQVRMAPVTLDVEKVDFPKILTECGCGDCARVTDPHLDPSSIAETGFHDVWDDILGSEWALYECPDPVPTTLSKAREAYLRTEKYVHDHPEYTSRCERAAAKHGKILDAERELLHREFGGNTTAILFTFRISPIDVVDGQRYWATPWELDGDLHESWSNITGTLRYQLRDKLGLNYEYLALTTATTIAATPHTHMIVWVDDPEDDVTLGECQSVVESHVNNCPRAVERHHPVESGKSDAAIVQHDPWISTYDGRGGTAKRIMDAHGGEWTKPNTRVLEYAACQRPHWIIKNVYDGTTDIHRDSVLVDGGAVALARQRNWLKSSGGMDVQNGTVSR